MSGTRYDVAIHHPALRRPKRNNRGDEPVTYELFRRLRDAGEMRQRDFVRLYGELGGSKRAPCVNCNWGAYITTMTPEEYHVHRGKFRQWLSHEYPPAIQRVVRDGVIWLVWLLTPETPDWRPDHLIPEDYRAD